MKRCACGSPATTVMEYGLTEVEARNFWCDVHALLPQVYPILRCFPIGDNS